MTETQQASATEQALRDLVAQRVDVRWAEFSQSHPHLARCIERTTLVETAVSRLIEDEDYQQAMEAAGHDEKILAAAVKVVGGADQWVRRILGL